MSCYSHVFVDLDGTFIKENISLEVFKAIMIKRPLTGLKMIMNTLLNKKLVNIEILNDNHKFIPYSFLNINNKLFSFLKKEKSRKKKIILATGAPVQIAREFNKHIGDFFEHVIGSYDLFQCISKNKLKAIKEFAPNCDFLYIGDSLQDIEVWKGSSYCGVIGEIKGVKNFFKENKMQIINVSKND